MLLKMTVEVRIQGGAAGGVGDSPDVNINKQYKNKKRRKPKANHTRKHTNEQAIEQRHTKKEKQKEKSLMHR